MIILQVRRGKRGSFSGLIFVPNNQTSLNFEGAGQFLFQDLLLRAILKGLVLRVSSLMKRQYKERAPSVQQWQDHFSSLKRKKQDWKDNIKYDKEVKILSEDGLSITCHPCSNAKNTKNT